MVAMSDAKVMLSLLIEQLVYSLDQKAVDLEPSWLPN